MAKITLEAYKKAFREVKKEEEKRGFLVHLTIYIIINAALAIINLIYSRETSIQEKRYGLSFLWHSGDWV